MAKRFALGGVLIVLLSAVAVATALLLEVHKDIGFVREGVVPIPGIKVVLDDVPARRARPRRARACGGAPPLPRPRRRAEKTPPPPLWDTIIVVRLDPDKK